MTTDHETWNPRSTAVLENQVAAYDELRTRCPVAHDESGAWTLFRHAEVLRVALDHATFSSDVSSHLQVPNGMDPPAHTAYRAIVDRYYTPDVVGAFEDACRAIAATLVEELPRGTRAAVMTDLAEPFALRVQSAYLGWPVRLEEPLRAWTARNRAATLARDPAAAAAVADEFDGYITGLLDERRSQGGDAPDDLTTRLMRERVDGRPLTDAELVSILRNWTVGELGTISASVGIVVHLLATRPDVQETLRRYPVTITEATDEMLRIEPPVHRQPPGRRAAHHARRAPLRARRPAHRAVGVGRPRRGRVRRSERVPPRPPRARQPRVRRRRPRVPGGTAGPSGAPRARRGAAGRDLAHRALARRAADPCRLPGRRLHRPVGTAHRRTGTHAGNRPGTSPPRSRP